MRCLFMISFLLLLVLQSSSAASCGDQWSVQLQGSTLSLENTFKADISGTSGQYAIDIMSNRGVVTQGDRVTNVAINFQIPWNQLTLYAFVGADSTGVMMGWAYCQGDSLTDIWLEDTTGEAGFTKPQMTGSCSIQKTPTNSTLTVSDQCYEIDSPPNVPTISGTDLNLRTGAPGKVTLAGDLFNLLPFAIVECTSCQAANMDGGWVEIHAVVKSKTNICLGIFYLQIKPTSTIPLNYLNCFFEQIEDLEFTGTYQFTGSTDSTTLDVQVASSTTVSSASRTISATSRLSSRSASTTSTTSKSPKATTTSISAPSAVSTSASLSTPAASRADSVTMSAILTLASLLLFLITI